MPGSGKQPPEIQEQIKELLEAGFDPTTIHRRLKVGRSSIYRMKRCLQQHGTNYMPPEMNKKNGRPKVLNPEQELEVRNWLRDAKNRTRYLDDLVWLIHDRFNIVCSTTTMSKMKRKWLRVIEYEEHGVPIDELTRSQLTETHPDLPILSDPNAFQLTIDHHPQQQQSQQHVDQQQLEQQLEHHHHQAHIHQQNQQQQQQRQQQDQQQQQHLQMQQHIPDIPQMSTMQVPILPDHDDENNQPMPLLDPQIDAQLEQQIHGEMGVGGD